MAYNATILPGLTKLRNDLGSDSPIYVCCLDAAHASIVLIIQPIAHVQSFPLLSFFPSSSPTQFFRPKKPTRGHAIVASSQVCNVCLSVLLHIPDHWLTMPLIRPQNVSTNLSMLAMIVLCALRTSDRCVVYSVPSSYFSLPFTGLDLLSHVSSHFPSQNRLTA